MSTRFGRNKRRRAREALQAMEAQASQLQQETTQLQQRLENLREHARTQHELVELQRRKLSDAEMFTRRVAHMVGRHSMIVGAAVPATLQMTLENADRYGFQMPTLDMTRHAIMHTLRIQSVADHFSQVLHVDAQLANQRSRYSISGYAIRHSSPEELVDHIGPSIMRQLAEMLKGYPG